MKTQAILSLLIGLSSFTTVFAEDTTPQSRKGAPTGELGGRRNKPMVDNYLERLKNVDPEEYQRLSTLKQEDPQAFRMELRKRAYKANREGKRGVTQRGPNPLRPEIAAVRAANTPEALNTAVDALRTKIQEQVEKNLVEREAAIEKIRAKLKQLEEQNEKERKQEVEIVEHHLQRILENIDQPELTSPQP